MRTPFAIPQWTVCTSEGIQMGEKTFGTQDTQGEWFFSKKVHILAIKCAQDRTKQTETGIGIVNLTVP